MFTLYRRRISRLWKPDIPVPEHYRRTFLSLYLDCAGFGILNGTIITFLLVYATRLGASNAQVGILSAMPAVTNLLVTFPIGFWLEKLPIGKATFWSALLTRIFYLLMACLPFFLAPKVEIWVLIGITFLMNIPGTLLVVAFNALFAQAVPLRFRGYVAGIRNAALAVFSTLSILACGYILNTMPFPQGYQVVFLIGAVGALISTAALWFVRPQQDEHPEQEILPDPLVEEKKEKKAAGWAAMLRFDVLKGKFSQVLFGLFAFHLFQYLPIPLFPIFMVKVMKLSDGVISLGSSIFYVSVFIGSMQLARISGKWGNNRVVGIGAMLMISYPFLLALNLGLFSVISSAIAGGVGWAFAGGAIYNYIYDRIPSQEHARYLAWYNLALNAAILLGSLCGPLLADWMGLTLALVVFSVGRFLAGFYIYRWG